MIDRGHGSRSQGAGWTTLGSRRAVEAGGADRGWLALILVAASLIRLVGLADHDLWYDEALEVMRDRLPWSRILLFSDGPDPPLFRVLMSPLARWSSSEAVLRAPSVLFSVVTIWLVHRWLVRLGDSRLALVTAALLAIAPVQVFYAQEVSQYALASMVGAATLLTMQMVIDGGASRDWIAFGAASVVALLTYYGLVFLLAAVNLVIVLQLARERDRVQIRRFVFSMSALLLVAALLTWAMLAQQYAKFATDHLRPLIDEPPSRLLQILGDRLELDVLGFFWRPWADAAPRWLLVPPLALMIAGSARMVVTRDRSGVIAFVLGVSLAAMWVAHVLGFYPFGFRYALFLSPLLLALVAAGILCLHDHARVVGLAAAAVVVVTQVAFLPYLGGLNPWVKPPYENLSRALQWVVARNEPSTPVYVYYGSWAAFALYKGQLGDQPLVRGSNLRRLSSTDKVATVRRQLSRHPRAFVVGSHLWQDDQKILLDALLAPEGGRRLVALVEEQGAFAALLDARP